MRTSLIKPENLVQRFVQFLYVNNCWYQVFTLRNESERYLDVHIFTENWYWDFKLHDGECQIKICKHRLKPEPKYQYHTNADYTCMDGKACAAPIISELYVREYYRDSMKPFRYQSFVAADGGESAAETAVQ